MMIKLIVNQSFLKCFVIFFIVEFILDIYKMYEIIWNSDNIKNHTFNNKLKIFFFKIILKILKVYEYSIFFFLTEYHSS